MLTLSKHPIAKARLSITKSNILAGYINLSDCQKGSILEIIRLSADCFSLLYRVGSSTAIISIKGQNRPYLYSAIETLQVIDDLAPVKVTFI